MFVDILSTNKPRRIFSAIYIVLFSAMGLVCLLDGSAFFAGILFLFAGYWLWRAITRKAE
jgi:hypothetical protein